MDITTARSNLDNLTQLAGSKNPNTKEVGQRITWATMHIAQTREDARIMGSRGYLHERDILLNRAAEWQRQLDEALEKLGVKNGA